MVWGREGQKMLMREQLYISTLAKYRNITQAAKELYISQPALSMYISTLEKDLGIKIFNRIGNKFVLTYAGKLYVEAAEKMLEVNRQLKAAISDIKDEATGSLRVGMYLRRTTFILPVVLRAFMAKYPKVNFQLIESDYESLYNKLLNGELDIIMVNANVKNNKNMKYIHVFDDRLMAVISKDNPKAFPDRKPKGQEKYGWIDLSRFKEDLFILQCEEQSTRKYADQAMKYHKIKPTKSLIETNMETACQMAAEGIGIAFNMESYINKFSYDKGFKVFYAGDPKVKARTVLVYNKNMYLPNYMKCFIQLMQEKCQEILF